MKHKNNKPASWENLGVMAVRDWAHENDLPCETQEQWNQVARAMYTELWAPTPLTVINEIIAAFPELDTNEPLSGADAVDRLSALWLRIKIATDPVVSTGYYADELSQIDPTQSEYAPKIQIRDGERDIKTKHLSLNAESAAALRYWLNKYYKA